MRVSRVVRATMAIALAGGLVFLPASAGGAAGTTAGTASSLSQRYLPSCWPGARTRAGSRRLARPARSAQR